MMRKERAVLTVEASLTLTLFMFFVMFLLSFNRVYSAQNTVSHATLQTADAVSAESMLRANASAENIADLLTVSNHIYAGESIPASALEKLTNGNISEIAKRDFIAAIAETESEADAVLKKYGVKDGLAGIDFSGCSYNADTGETIIFVRYTVELQFPIIGFKEFPMTKAAKVNNMGKETYTITVVSENPEMGTTSGTVKVRKGESAVIAAYPNYGCVFTGWREGGSENPKTLTNVNCDMTFTARFKKSNYNVEAGVNNDEYGSTTGSGSYDFNDVAVLTAKPRVNGGYKFLGWDENGNSKIDAGESTSERLEIKVRRDVNVTAIFEPIKYTVTVKTSGNGTAVLTTANGETKRTGSSAGDSVSMELSFNTKITIKAESNKSQYPFKKWSGAIDSSNARLELNVPVGGGVYEAHFESKRIKFTNSEKQKYVDHKAYARDDDGKSGKDSTKSKLIKGISNNYKLTTNYPNDQITWISADKNIATVKNGVVKVGKKSGTVKITAKVNGSENNEVSVYVTVKHLMTSVEYHTDSYEKLYDYRHYYAAPYNKKASFWIYRYEFIDDYTLKKAKVVDAQKTTSGKLQDYWHDVYDKINNKIVYKEDKRVYLMEGTNKTSKRAYCLVTWGGDKDDKTYEVTQGTEIGKLVKADGHFDMPFFDQGYYIQYIGFAEDGAQKNEYEKILTNGTFN